MTHTKDELIAAGYLAVLDDYCRMQAQIAVMQAQIDGLAALLQEHIAGDGPDYAKLAAQVVACGVRQP